LKTAPRVLILTPTALPAVTGNAVTAERWRRALAAQGLDVKVLASLESDARGLLDLLRSFDPDLVHVHHASRAGALLLDPLLEPETVRRALVVSPGGTDIHQDLNVPRRAAVVRAVCRRARAIVAQSEQMVRCLLTALPDVADKIFRIPKAVGWLGDEPFDLAGAAAPGPGGCLFFLPAGVRPVKGNLECLLLLERVHHVRPQVRVVFAGPAIDPAYAGRFRRETDRCGDFARWIPLVPPPSMRAAYRGADVVLNASLSEGLSNALLEALSEGKPLLVSRVHGNVWPVLGDPGEPPAGLLFDPADPDGFVRQALRLVDDRGLRERLGAAGKQRAARQPGPEAEALGLVRVYEAALRWGPVSSTTAGGGCRGHGEIGGTSIGRTEESRAPRFTCGARPWASHRS